MEENLAEDLVLSDAGVERITGLTWRPVRNVAEVSAALAHGTELRATSATAMNATSSRSHAVLSVRLAFAGAGQSSLHLVDLAGKQILVWHSGCACSWSQSHSCQPVVAHAALPTDRSATSVSFTECFYLFERKEVSLQLATVMSPSTQPSASCPDLPAQ